MALVSHLVDSDSSVHQEVAQQHVWQDVMVEKYTSIMENDVWEVVLRPTYKAVVGSH